MATEESSVAKNKDYGCKHYKRRCKLIAPCCSKQYPCRICHDEAENHEMDRFKVLKVACLGCGLEQEKQGKCTKCGVTFGNYFCTVCTLYDDEDKKQFHCDGCGLCRVGGRDNFFHCEKCDMCLGMDLKNHHKCIEKSSHSNCAVCLEDLHSSRIPAHIPQCGHLIHRACFTRMLETSNYACPTCGQSMVDMKEVWQHLDEEVANCHMPEEYKDYYVQILCKDCHKESNVLFHVLGLKCQSCGSYNTCRTAEPDTGASGDTENSQTNTEQENENSSGTNE